MIQGFGFAQMLAPATLPLIGQTKREKQDRYGREGNDEPEKDDEEGRDHVDETVERSLHDAKKRENLF